MPSETQFKHLLALAPALTELKFHTGTVKAGDQIVAALVKTRDIDNRLEALSFLNLRLSSAIIDRFFSRLHRTSPIMLVNDMSDDEYAPTEAEVLAEACNGSRSKVEGSVNEYFPKLRILELLDLPPKLHRERHSPQHYRVRRGTATEAAVDIARGCPTLKTLRLINPQHAAASIEVDVSASRAGAPCVIDDAKYAIYSESLPKLTSALMTNNKRVLEETHRERSRPWSEVPKLW